MIQRQPQGTNTKFAREVWWYTLGLTVYAVAFYAYRQWLFMQKELASFSIFFWAVCAAMIIAGIVLSVILSRLASRYTVMKQIVLFEIVYLVAAFAIVGGLWLILFR